MVSLYQLNLEDISLFTINIEQDDVQTALNSFRLIKDSLGEGTFDILTEHFPDNERQTNSEDPHEPITIRGITPADMNGIHGRLTAEEILRPYLWNGKRMETLSGTQIVSAIKVEENVLQRSDHYILGQVHAFEDILAVMSDWYGYPLDRTAAILQQMYSGPIN